MAHSNHDIFSYIAVSHQEQGDAFDFTALQGSSDIGDGLGVSTSGSQTL